MEKGKRMVKSLLMGEYAFNVLEADFFLTHTKERTVKKRQIISHPEFMAKNRFFIVKGAFKSYVIDASGNCQVIALRIDGWDITDNPSYFNGLPGTMFIEALEDSVVLQLSDQNERLLKKQSHAYERIFSMLAERNCVFMERRIISCLSKSAEERYLNFAKYYPEYLRRVPQNAIASYLGMTSQYLSRIKNKQL